MLQDLLYNYQSQYPDEKIIVDKMREFLNEHKDCFSRSNITGHFTGSGWLVDEERNWVVLTHHKKLGKWLQLGGHADDNNNLLEVALTECTEESGLQSVKVISEQIFDIDIHIIPRYEDTPKHLHFDVRFLFEAIKGLEPIIASNESNEVAWIKLDHVHTKNSEQSLQRMVKKTKAGIWT